MAFKPSFKVKIERDQWMEGSLNQGDHYCAMGFAAKSLQVAHRLGYVHGQLETAIDLAGTLDNQQRTEKIRAEAEKLQSVQDLVIPVNDANLIRVGENWYIRADIPKNRITRKLRCMFNPPVPDEVLQELHIKEFLYGKSAKESSLLGPYKSHDDAVKGKEEFIESFFNSVGFEVKFTGRRKNASVGDDIQEIEVG